MENEYERILRRSLLCHIIKIDFFHIFCTCNFFFFALKEPHIYLFFHFLLYTEYERTLCCVTGQLKVLSRPIKKKNVSISIPFFFFELVVPAVCFII